MKVKKTTYQSSSSKNNEIIKLTNEIKNAIQKIEEKKNKTVDQYSSLIQSIKKEYQRVDDENNHLKKRNEQLEQYIIKEERKKQEYSFKIKYTESSGSKDEYQYCCKKPSKQRKNKQKYHGYESYDDEDYSNGPRVKQNKRKNYYYEDDNNSQNKKDDDNSLNKKDTKKKKIPRRRV